jgi:hypothetical protein
MQIARLHANCVLAMMQVLQYVLVCVRQCDCTCVEERTRDLIFRRSFSEAVLKETGFAEMSW